MDWYRLRFSLGSPTATPWQSDTIFGHLCWALAYTEGDAYLDNFLGLYEIGDPPIILSNGFPNDLLPRPLASPLSSKAPQTLEEGLQVFRESKRLRKSTWVTREGFEAARRGESYTPVRDDPWRTVVTTHNQISRITSSSALEGGLYTLEGWYLSHGSSVIGRERAALEGDSGAGEKGHSIDCERWVTVYALIHPGFRAAVDRWADYLVATGYGKRKSAGLGAILEVKIEQFEGFPPVENANGFVSLSNFVPANGDPVKGMWKTVVKRGKLGEHLANSGDPFKLPLVMLEAGSCFYDRPVRQYYGRLVRGVHPNRQETVQYGICLPVSMRLP